MGLGAIILAVLSQAVVPLTRQILAGFHEMEVAREAQVVDTAFERDLALTPHEARDFTGGSRWVLRPLLPEIVGSDRAYGGELVAYELASGVLVRRSCVGKDLPTGTAALGQWGPVLASGGAVRRLAMGVTEFAVDVEGGAVVLDATLERMGGGRKVSYRLHRVYGGRNP